MLPLPMDSAVNYFRQVVDRLVREEEEPHRNVIADRVLSPAD
jgi:hypothetical protein